MDLASQRRLVQAASSRAALQEASRFLRDHAGAEILAIAHTRAAADDLVRGLESGAVGVHRVTPAMLAHDLATRAMADRGLSRVPPLGMEALAARVAFSLRTKLKYFAPVAAMPGFARALAATLRDLRLAGVAPAALKKRGGACADLARLLDAYESELAARKLADRALLFALATESAASGVHRLLGHPLLLLCVSLDDEPARRLLREVARRASSVLAVSLTGDPQNAGLSAVVDAEPEHLCGGGNTRLRHLQRNLFVAGSVAAGAPDDSFEFFSAPGEGLECIEIARRIRKLGRAQVPLDRIAILLRSPERYQPLLEEAMRRARIPASFTRGSARPDVAGRAFLTLLECAQEGCTASRFAEYLSLGQVPDPQPDGSPGRGDFGFVPPRDDAYANLNPYPEPDPPAPDSPAGVDSPVVSGTLQTPAGWEKLIVDASVIGGGEERWARRLQGLRAEMTVRLHSLDRDDDGQRSYLETQIARLGNLERFALPIIARLSALPEEATWADWLDQLADLASAALRQPGRVLAVFSELEPMAKVGPVTLDEVFQTLFDRLRFLRADPPLDRYGRVWVGSIEEARGREFTVVFLPGLAEGLFPGRVFEDPLLLDQHRASISPSLPVRDDKVDAERFLLHAASAAASEKLIASYPRMEVAQARPRVPSFYALELPRSVEGALPNLRRFERQAREAAPARLNWPAPRDPADAIDAAEYDLAVLAPAAAAGDPEPGIAHYLMEASPVLARSLRSRWRRWNSKWSEADGIVEPDPEARQLLLHHRGSQRAYSPTALQQFAACPYKFALHAIHGLRPRECPSALERMDPLTRGSLFHQVQFELFRDLQAAGMLPMSPWKREQILQASDRVLNRVAAEFAEELAPALDRVWRSEVEDLRTDLRGWIQHALEEDADWIPAHFELGFGRALDGSHDAASSAEEIRVLDGLKLRGSVDLVEKHRTRGVYRVTDHKTGKPPDRVPGSVGGGAVLQPALYGLAVERILGATVESGRLFYATQRGNFQRFSIPLHEVTRNRVRQVAEAIDRALSSGFLPAAPQRGACGLCDYAVICGPYEEDRIRRKPKDALENLNHVRSLP
ncbi:MAG: PD-(D/E)XK nuclease family protein [Bryobacteraceae bacterium]|nr:PD-(D/E)XK nuclease family protein [Bryobacteraceae bacterium]